MRVVTAGWRQLSEVGIKVRATLRTGVLRIGDHEITRTPHVEMPQIVQRPLELLVPRGLGTTTRTGVLLGIATVGDALWLWQLCKRCDPFRRVGAIRTWTEHCVALLARMFRPEQYDKCPSGATRYPRYSLCVFGIMLILVPLPHLHNLFYSLAVGAVDTRVKALV